MMRSRMHAVVEHHPVRAAQREQGRGDLGAAPVHAEALGLGQGPVREVGSGQAAG